MAQQMMSNMMQGFGGDPFANDPFFKEPFGHVDKMMSRMRKEMQQAMAEPFGMDLNSHGMKSGQFSQMQQVTKSRMDQHGNPVRETYQTKAKGAFGNGSKLVERH